MGDGYWSNWYVADTWVGPLKANFKEGTTPWVEWTNETTDYTYHNEFDLKIQKSAWMGSTGYPAKFSDIDGSIDVSMTGQYTSGSIGKGHINITAWFTAESTWDADGVDRVDIIVHAFDNEGDFANKYVENGTGDETYVNMGTIEASNGMDYKILRTRPGGCGELATYNLIPDAVIQEDPYDYISTDEIESNIDMQEIISALIEVEENFDGTQISISEDWYVFILEWTVVGQCGAYNEDGSGGFIPNSMGRFTFNSYSIPDLVTLKSQSFQNESLADEEQLQDINVFPNPFTDSFQYEYSVETDDNITISLYTIDGEKVKTLKDMEYHSAGNYSDVINTGDLTSGVYMLQFSSSEGDKIIKVIKK
jgi:hypothetical protein